MRALPLMAPDEVLVGKTLKLLPGQRGLLGDDEGVKQFLGGCSIWFTLHCSLISQIEIFLVVLQQAAFSISFKNSVDPKINRRHVKMH